MPTLPTCRLSRFHGWPRSGVHQKMLIQFHIFSPEVGHLTVTRSNPYPSYQDDLQVWGGVRWSIFASACTCPPKGDPYSEKPPWGAGIWRATCARFFFFFCVLFLGVVLKESKWKPSFRGSETAAGWKGRTGLKYQQRVTQASTDTDPEVVLPG